MNKKLLVAMVLIAGVCFAANTIVVPVDKTGARVDPGALQTDRSRWVVLDTTSSTGDEPTDLAVTERTYQTVKTAIATAASGDDEISILDVPRGWNGLRIRAQGITDDGTYTVQLYAGTLGDGYLDSDSTTQDCELAYIGQIAWVIGTQASITSTYEMADTATFTASDWTNTATTASPTGNRVAEVKIDLLGADVLVVVPTVASADSKLLVRGF